MHQNDSEKNIKRITIPLTLEELEKLKKLSKVDDRSLGRAAQRLIREGLERAEQEGRI